MIRTHIVVRLLVSYLCCVAITASTSDLRCNIRVRIESGWVCGLRRNADYDVEYASFRGIPYAQQPLGELRFKELQPVRPWPHHLDATEEGPVCPQQDDVYGHLVQPYRGMSESCIYVNVHVPLKALPAVIGADDDEHHKGYNVTSRKGVPILIFIHGGGFQAGSGNADLNGPEYLVSKGIIVITFNYRINVFGFLSLNTTKIPGNAGLRDQVTLLRWVQRNAEAFGGDPKDVTLAGQSAGAACVHLLSLSDSAKGLFNRIISMSGTAIPSFYTVSPTYARLAAIRFLSLLGINSTDPDVIHDQLVNKPLEEILNANSIYQYESGLMSFGPVIEGRYPGVTQIIEDDPIKLIKEGRGKELPMIIGFTNEECEFFKYRLEYLDILGRIKANPTLVLRADIPFTTPPNVALGLAEKVIDRYFNRKLTIDKYLEECRDSLFEYPAFKVSEWRAKTKAAPTYLYQFAYEGDFSVVKAALYLNNRGSAHVEDLTYIFRANSVLGKEKPFSRTTRDDRMKDWMTQFVIDFIQWNKPTCGQESWPAVQPRELNYQDIREPDVYYNRPPTAYQRDMIQFFDGIEQIARNFSLRV